MNAQDFCCAILKAFIDQEEAHSEVTQYFLNEINQIRSTQIDEVKKMTMATVLFEGFYRHVEDPHVRSHLIELRTRRWESHFGTPTVPFLLSYSSPIEKTKQFFDNFLKKEDLLIPWTIEQSESLIVDRKNNVLTDPQCMNRVIAPPQREVMGLFTKTHNPFGGFTTAPCDPVSQRFIEDAAIAAQHGGKVLEIGAAFGAATLEAIARGATVFCNDINPENLAVVRKRLEEINPDDADVSTGDSSKLVLVPGALPHELSGLPKQSFDAILICRVLHFFTGKEIEASLALLSKLLAPKGKIYIVCETPYLKNWQRFLPEFQNRVDHHEEWPGEVTNPAEFESSGRAASLPKFVHWITKEILERSLTRCGFDIEHSEYINRAGQFPDDLLLPDHGKESIGAIGVVRR